MASASSPCDRSGRAPSWLFTVELGYLLLLFGVFVLYVELDGFRDGLPGSLGSLPIAAPWFGAVGAVLAGLGGHFFHYNDWDESYNRWHLSRPFLGAIEGPVGCLLLLVMVRAASKQAPSSDAAFYDAAAFLVGFAEKNFRALIDKATKVIIAPGDTGDDTVGTQGPKPKRAGGPPP